MKAEGFTTVVLTEGTIAHIFLAGTISDPAGGTLAKDPARFSAASVAIGYIIGCFFRTIHIRIFKGYFLPHLQLKSWIFFKSCKTYRAIITPQTTIEKHIFRVLFLTGNQQAAFCHRDHIRRYKT